MPFVAGGLNGGRAGLPPGGTHRTGLLCAIIPLVSFDRPDRSRQRRGAFPIFALARAFTSPSATRKWLADLRGTRLT